MSERDFDAFTRFLSEDAVFIGDTECHRGKSAIEAVWKPLYSKPQAPFSWRPERVEVLTSGDLALSSGPVFNAQGQIIARFSSIWRREAPGVWRIVFDQGGDVCNCDR